MILLVNSTLVDCHALMLMHNFTCIWWLFLFTFCWTGNRTSGNKFRIVYKIFVWAKPFHGQCWYQAWSAQAYSWFGIANPQEWAGHWKKYFGFSSYIPITGTAMVPFEAPQFMFQNSYITSQHRHWTSSYGYENLEVPS